MCHVVDLRRSIVCAVSNRHQLIGDNELPAGCIGNSPRACTRKLVRWIDRDGASRL
jgi:hypothetical protein